MKALIVSYQRGRHLVHQNHAIIKIEGIGERAKASSLNGKKVMYTTKAGKVLNGVITKAHGAKGLVLARFDTGLPGQAIGSEIAIKE
ncbi:MAG TPA: 50S ribosomal protein L35ae [Candidatus Nanoarchaeia archaeon]|nr:50S ribosomal protein L35ae [Candidatus Nanoarchaeia archaeon]